MHSSALEHRPNRQLRLRHVDLSNPGFALFTVFFFTVIPYLYPIQYFPAIKYWDIESHIAFSIAFSVLTWGLYIPYALALVHFPARSEPIRQDEHFLDLLFFVCQIAIWISISASLLLVGFSLASGGGGLVKSMRSVGENLSGYTILTQLHIGFAEMYIYIAWRRRIRIRWLIGLLMLVLLLRSVLLSERMALLEGLVPILVLSSYLQIIRITWFRISMMSMFFVSFFVLAEITRSFYAKFIYKGASFLSLDFVIAWNIERFFIYYIDVLSKAYFVISEQLFYTTEFWKRGIISVMQNFTSASFGDENFWLILDMYNARTPEMTNPGGITELFSDFGMWGIGVYLIFIASFLIAHFELRRGNLFCYAMYPLLFLNFTDFVRRIYFYESRLVVPLTCFIAAFSGLWLFSLSQRNLSAQGRTPSSWPRTGVPARRRAP